MPIFNDPVTVTNDAKQPLFRVLNGSPIFIVPGVKQALATVNGVDGSIMLRSKDLRPRIHLDPANGNIWLGGNDMDGDLVLFPRGGDNQTTAKATIHLSGDAGDIVLQNADCAEDFPISERGQSEPGTVMVIEPGGTLRPSDAAYDKRVAGVISGAGGLRPGIILGKQPEQRRAVAVALSGKVFCQADAAYGPIEFGDLLTTSPTAGHAMKAQDRDRAFGAVIGKALDSLTTGRGLVAILVALQ